MNVLFQSIRVLLSNLKPLFKIHYASASVDPNCLHFDQQGLKPSDHFSSWTNAMSMLLLLLRSILNQQFMWKVFLAIFQQSVESSFFPCPYLSLTHTQSSSSRREKDLGRHPLDHDHKSSSQYRNKHNFWVNHGSLGGTL